MCKTLLALILLVQTNFVFASKGNDGLLYGYNGPEIFYQDDSTINLSIEYTILNCFAWNDQGQPVNQCVDMAFVADDGNQSYSAPLNQDVSCLTDECRVGLSLPIVSLLTPQEYSNYVMGQAITKKILLKLAFGSDESQKGFAKAFYDLTYVLDPKSYDTIKIKSFVRHE